MKLGDMLLEVFSSVLAVIILLSIGIVKYVGIFIVFFMFGFIPLFIVVYISGVTIYPAIGGGIGCGLIGVFKLFGEV